jgi:hypothetical protein
MSFPCCSSIRRVGTPTEPPCPLCPHRSLPHRIAFSSLRTASVTSSGCSTWTYVPVLMITHFVAFYLLLRPQPKAVRALAGDAAAS